MSKETEAIKVSGIRRLWNQILQSISKSSLLPGKLRSKLQSLRGVQFTNVSSVFIGEDVIIDGVYPQNVFIGNRCIITAGVKILTHFLDTEKLSNNPDFYFRFYQGKVIIEDDVFIGLNSVIAKPVTIGKGAIIGANTVITKNVPPGAVMVGTPARNINSN